MFTGIWLYKSGGGLAISMISVEAIGNLADATA